MQTAGTDFLVNSTRKAQISKNSNVRGQAVKAESTTDALSVQEWR
jgi:hypothetical protein